MSQTTIDLWPERFGPTNARFPVAILREQAALLGTKTDNLVQAEVKPIVNQKGPLTYNFYLVAPALDNYRYFLFGVSHDAGNIYPVELFLEDSGSAWVQIPSEDEFLRRLADVFNSDRTMRVIESLIAQSRATGMMKP